MMQGDLGQKKEAAAPERNPPPTSQTPKVIAGIAIPAHLTHSQLPIQTVTADQKIGSRTPVHSRPSRPLPPTHVNKHKAMPPKLPLHSKVAPERSRPAATAAQKIVTRDSAIPRPSMSPSKPTSTASTKESLPSNPKTIPDSSQRFDAFRRRPLQVGIEYPTDSDILCGRGSGINLHPGNIRYREFLSTKREIYLLGDRATKRAISISIVKAMQQTVPRALFLEKDSTTGLWHEICDSKAVEKASQALRQRSDEGWDVFKEIKKESIDFCALDAAFRESMNTESTHKSAKRRKTPKRAPSATLPAQETRRVVSLGKREREHAFPAPRPFKMADPTQRRLPNPYPMQLRPILSAPPLATAPSILLHSSQMQQDEQLAALLEKRESVKKRALALHTHAQAANENAQLIERLIHSAGDKEHIQVGVGPLYPSASAGLPCSVQMLHGSEVSVASDHVLRSLNHEAPPVASRPLASPPEAQANASWIEINGNHERTMVESLRMAEEEVVAKRKSFFEKLADGVIINQPLKAPSVSPTTIPQLNDFSEREVLESMNKAAEEIVAARKEFFGKITNAAVTNKP